MKHKINKYKIHRQIKNVKKTSNGCHDLQLLDNDNSSKILIE